MANSPRAPIGRRMRSRYARALLAGLAWLWASMLWPAPALAQVELPASDPTVPLHIAADAGSRWIEGKYEVWHLQGNCYINQGLTYARSSEAVVFIEPAADGRPSKAIVWLEGGVEIRYHETRNLAQGGPKSLARVTEKTWLGRFHSNAAPTVRVLRVLSEPLARPEIHARAAKAMAGEEPGKIRPVQYAEPGVRLPTPDAPPPETRRLQVFPRSDVPFQVDGYRNPATNEWIAVVTSGVQLIVDGIEGFGSLDVATDRLVIWTSGTEEPTLTGATLQHRDVPLELYMEGNIVFRQGDRVVQAQRMYYDVRRQVGVIIGAELLTPVPSYQGLLRLRADVMQQLNQNQFVAQNASLTSSRLGEPTYEFRSGTLSFTDVPQPVVDPATGAPAVNPMTGEPIINHQRLATSENNIIYLAGFPVFYWPTITTDLEEPNYYIDRIRVKNDEVFGTQILTDFNAYQLLGLDRIDGTKWDLSLDYMSMRGLGYGTSFLYDRNGLFDIPGRYYGVLDAWAIKDHGHDNLGRTRRDLFPEKDFRGRVFSRHRQYLPDNYQLSLEVGLISDRNFLEQYFENEWDQFKDQATGFELKRLVNNSSWSLAGDVRVNDFFTETEQIRLDHFWLGQPLLDDTLTWFEHSHIAYMDMELATVPLNPADAALFGYLPWEVPGQGERVATRQEIDLPLQAGPVKIVPYALGELAHWGEVIDGEDKQRAYGQLGVRASLPMWSVDPTVESQLWNLHGLAHKVVYETDIAFTDASANLEEFQLYDQIDDNQIEHFRRRFAFTTFGAPPPVPVRFDERFFAVRRGIQSEVTGPTEIAEDLLAARFGVLQRWQTKRGPAANRRIVDWIVFDTSAVIFPDADRDNFGEELGMVDYDFRWYVGDRVTLVSDGFFEFFDEGPKYFTVGAFLNRPPRGSFYLGLRSMEGPISSNVIAAAYTYRMSPKWVSTFGSTYDFGDTGNIGQNFSLTRIGESFLVSANFNVDASKGSVGANFMVEPRFLRRGSFGPAGGVLIPPAGAFGLE